MTSRALAEKKKLLCSVASWNEQNVRVNKKFRLIVLKCTLCIGYIICFKINNFGSLSVTVLPLIIPAPLKQKKVSSISNNSRPLIIPAL